MRVPEQHLANRDELPMLRICFCPVARQMEQITVPYVGSQLSQLGNLLLSAPPCEIPDAVPVLQRRLRRFPHSVHPGERLNRIGKLHSEMLGALPPAKVDDRRCV